MPAVTEIFQTPDVWVRLEVCTKPPAGLSHTCWLGRFHSRSSKVPSNQLVAEVDNKVTEEGPSKVSIIDCSCCCLRSAVDLWYSCITFPTSNGFAKNRHWILSFDTSSETENAIGLLTPSSLLCLNLTFADLQEKQSGSLTLSYKLLSATFVDAQENDQRH